ncbi:MAG: hypothetical protein KKC80_00560 [Candidatus Margulisbacteria bacterium]|nr:hypothetical protein [Candidatus Margulisiibacteriota bacterium]MBU1617704.1 hypothetical protein [Candidatus Margulisiibacteriota bacterium]
MTFVIGHWTFFILSPAHALPTFDPLAVGTGAQALGMGNAFVARNDAGDSLFNNPASLGEVSGFRFSSMSGSMMEDINFLLIGGALPVGSQTALGAGYCGAFISDIVLRDARGIAGKSAQYGKSAAFVSLGRKIDETFSVGGALKYYRIEATENRDSNGSGLNLDLGVTQKSLEWLSFGIVAQNVLGLSPINHQNGAKEYLTPTIKGGTRIHLLGSSYSAAFVSNLDLIMTIDTNISFQPSIPQSTNLGIEFSPTRVISLRAGLDHSTLTSGLSFNWAGLNFNYAYHPNVNDTSTQAHYFSIAYNELGWPRQPAPETFIALAN